MLLEDAGISTALKITPGQIASVSGDRSLPQAPALGIWRFYGPGTRRAVADVRMAI